MGPLLAVTVGIVRHLAQNLPELVPWSPIMHRGGGIVTPDRAAKREPRSRTEFFRLIVKNLEKKHPTPSPSRLTFLST